MLLNKAHVEHYQFLDIKELISILSDIDREYVLLTDQLDHLNGLVIQFHTLADQLEKVLLNLDEIHSLHAPSVPLFLEKEGYLVTFKDIEQAVENQEEETIQEITRLIAHKLLYLGFVIGKTEWLAEALRKEKIVIEQEIEARIPEGDK